MEYLLTFLEGITAFISPCMLPMLPVYITYFAGREPDKSKALSGAAGFILGFSILFVSLGAFAGQIGNFLRDYRFIINIVCGAVMVLFGLNFAGVIRLPFINNNRTLSIKTASGFLPSILFGIVFSISWSPCVGVFLGSALMLAAQSGSSLKGVLMLFSFSLGLGIPFILSAVLIDKLKSVFDFIKGHYRVINIVSGLLLVALGICVASGLINYFYSLL